jgi:hypothetical protein
MVAPGAFVAEAVIVALDPMGTTVWFVGWEIVTVGRPPDAVTLVTTMSTFVTANSPRRSRTRAVILLMPLVAPYQVIEHGVFA